MLMPTAEPAATPSRTSALVHQIWPVPSPARPCIGMVDRMVRTARTNHTPQTSTSRPKIANNAAYCSRVANRQNAVLSNNMTTWRGLPSSARASSTDPANGLVLGHCDRMRMSRCRPRPCRQRARLTRTMPPTIAVAMIGPLGSSALETVAATTTTMARLMTSSRRARTDTLVPLRAPMPRRPRARTMNVASADGPGSKRPAPHETPTVASN
jgi:hypothetical protein